MWRTILAGEVWRGELINRRKDGSLYYEQQTITPVRDERGAISQFIAVKQDISDRKTLEADLRDSEERYRMIFQMSEDAIFLTRPEDAGTLAVNPAGCQMFGYSEAELCSLGRAGIMDATDPGWEVLLAKRSRAGRARGQVRCVRRNGHIFPAEMSFVMFRDSKGQQRGIAHIRDISEPMRAEKALRESEMRWQFAVESHGDAMWDWDADKDALFLTPAAKELFNLLPDTDSARPIADILTRVFADDRALAQSQIDDIALGRRTDWAGEFRLSAHGGTLRWIATRGRVMTRAADGRPHRIVSISSDVTQQKIRQGEARRQRELVAQQARLVLLGELASALAHEINQPLTAITGFAAACVRKLEEVPEALELVHAIENQAMRAGEIAWRMRGFARRQSQGRSALPLNELIAGVVKWIQMDSVLSDAVIDLTGLAAHLPPVIADRVELEQVLVNLVRNGIEASLPNIREKPIAIAAQFVEDSGEIEISVADAGCGLPVTSDFDAFKPFVSTKVQGLGLGLTISYSIIEGHGGHLWATPNPTGGTIFHFTLPVAEKTAPMPAMEIPVGQCPARFADD
jgi:two-component system sensor kinase FixL